MQQDGAWLLDVRTRPEFKLNGHPVGAFNIPYKTFPTWKVDPQFVSKVKAWSNHHTMLVICSSGGRSLAATRLLRKKGVDAINVLEGFDGPMVSDGHRDMDKGWRNRKLPWGY